jgi:hypothetical protein
VELQTVSEQLSPLHVVVDFGSAIPSDAQGKVLLAMEKMLRGMGIPAEVFKRSLPDDSKLRRSMTPEQRAKL